jgi:parvulin-like peptidyl-prolyl isomerase
MKNTLFIAGLLLGSIAFTNAQSMGDLTKAANMATSTAAGSFDVASISNQVMGVLSPKLKLTDEQKPVVNSVVNEMLNKKKNILPTMATDKAGYASKMTENRDTFSSKMKKLISPTQFTALTALLPKSASAVTPLVQMLY